MKETCSNGQRLNRVPQSQTKAWKSFKKLDGIRRRPAPLQHVDPCDGILLVNKSSGPTSHDVVSRIRRHFRFKKVGHGGTLDPQATGLLVILIGRGTKLSSLFIESDKTYEGAMRLGISTDTHDAQGNVLRQTDYSFVTMEQLEAEMKKLTGDILQTPPMVSAVKMDGVPLYKQARKGQTVERKPRLIHVYEFRLIDFSPPVATFRIKCTKGTYVRTLCSDIGDALGCGAYLEQLCRIKSGDFELKDAMPMEEILKMDYKELIDKIIPVHRISIFPLTRRRPNCIGASGHLAPKEPTWHTLSPSG